MVHGHLFNFLDEPELQRKFVSVSENMIDVKEHTDPALLDGYNTVLPWVSLSGQQGRYFAKSSFEKADQNFSWGLEIKDQLTLVWKPKTRSILYIKQKNFSPKKLRFWIFHTFFPMVMELNRTYHFLHIGAVKLQGRTFFFSAPSFGGKSTLTDYCIQQGATLISDDALAIEKKGENYYAIPAYPYHRPYREPETLGYPVEKFAKDAQSIDAVFLLQKATPDTKVIIEEVKGIEKFKAFHQSIFIEFPFRKQERFAFFGQMAQSVPVYTITIPWDIERLDEVYQAIAGFETSNTNWEP